MKKRVLIIRSVSFQQLDKNLERIEKQFPVSRGEWECHLLTHDHGTRRAASYKAISQIIAYGSRKNFTFFHLPPGLRKSKNIYEAIIVPVTNKTGAGFLNVLAMTLRIPSASIYICNLTSDIWKVSRKKIVFQVVKSSWFSLLSVVLALPLLVFILPVLGFFFIKEGVAPPTHSRSARCRSFGGVISKVCRKSKVSQGISKKRLNDKSEIV